MSDKIGENLSQSAEDGGLKAALLEAERDLIEGRVVTNDEMKARISTFVEEQSEAAKWRTGAYQQSLRDDQDEDDLYRPN